MDTVTTSRQACVWRVSGGEHSATHDRPHQPSIFSESLLWLAFIPRIKGLLTERCAPIAMEPIAHGDEDENKPLIMEGSAITYCRLF
ncbi:hypothetical protein ACFFUP_15360 [Vibrio ostreicida]|nr:hypothetical protein [Vibrio ostreicida]NPD08559.1 hypothetical protein [Vibrio ostreicida]